MPVIAAAMLIRRVVQLVNGRRLEDVLDMGRWEQIGILICLTIFSAVNSINLHSVVAWATSGVIAIMTIAAICRPPKKKSDAPRESVRPSEHS